MVEHPYGQLPFVITPIAEHDSLYFITRHPFPSTVSFNMVSTLSPTVWKAFAAILLIIAAVFLMLMEPSNSYDITFVYIIGVFELQKSLYVRNCTLGISRKLLHIMWLLLAYMVLCVYYNVELHSMLIAEDFTKVPMKLSDLEFPADSSIMRLSAVKWLGRHLTITYSIFLCVINYRIQFTC